MKQTTKLAALVLLMAGLFAACAPEIELAGSAWTGKVGCTDNDGDTYTATYALVCNSSRNGMLFVDINYDEPMSFCFAMPVSYTWDGGKGTATATLSLPDIGTKTFSIPLSWSKTSGLQADFLSLAQALGIDRPTELEQKSFAKPASMDGTRWTLSFTWDDDGWNSSYDYELEFVDKTKAVLDLAITEGEDSDNERWNISYTYKSGIGTTTIQADGMTVQGGFYMPDNTHLFFCDGENGLLMTKQQ